MKKHVLLCSHNGENFIKDQILSIINQEEKIDYIHIFDFASTDTTYDQIIEIKETHKNYAWNISKINHAPGPAASFFYAIKKVSPLISSTDFILLADQDDVWLKNKVSSASQTASTFEEYTAQAPEARRCQARCSLSGSQISSWSANATASKLAQSTWHSR